MVRDTMRLIDGDALLKEANADGAYGYVSAEQIANAPTIEAEHVKHGRWVKIYGDGELAVEQHQIGIFCSRCNKMPKDRFTESNYCPNCGAKMENNI